MKFERRGRGRGGGAVVYPPVLVVKIRGTYYDYD